MSVPCLPLTYTAPVRDFRSSFYLVPPCPAPAAWWGRIEIVEQPNMSLKFLSLHNSPMWVGDLASLSPSHLLASNLFYLHTTPTESGMPATQPTTPVPTLQPLSHYGCSSPNILTQSSFPARFQKYCPQNCSLIPSAESLSTDNSLLSS